MRATLDKLVTAKGYPAEIRELAYDPMLARARPGRRPRQRQHLQARSLRLPGRARHGLETIDRAQGRRAVPARAHAAVEPALRVDRHAVRAARGGAVRLLVDYFDRHDVPASPTTRRCGSTSASASTWRTATARSRRSSARSCPSYVERDECAGRDAAQVPLVGQEAVPADQLGLGLHDAGDELPARRRAATGRRIRRGATTSTSSSSARRSRRSSPRSTRSSSSAPTASRWPRSGDGPFQRGRDLLGRQHQRVRGRAHGRPATRCCSSATTSTATCCAAGSRRSGARRWCCRSWSTRSAGTITCAPSWRGWTGWTPSSSTWIRSCTSARRRCASLQKLDEASSHDAERLAAAKRTVKDAIEKLRRDLRATAAQHRSAEARDRRQASTPTGGRCSAKATRSASSASRWRSTPASTRAACPTSASIRRCNTSAVRATACRTNAVSGDGA